MLMAPPPTDKMQRISFAQKTIRCLRVNSAVLLAGLFLTSVACSDQDNSIVSVALHPSKSHFMYVATNQAVYKTRDGGATWSKLPAFSARCTQARWVMLCTRVLTAVSGGSRITWA